jgi:hypothetical protein
MRNPVLKEIHPNYRKRILEITLGEGRKTKNALSTSPSQVMRLLEENKTS